MKEIIENPLGVICDVLGKSLSTRVASEQQDMVLAPGRYRIRPGYRKYNQDQMFVAGHPAKITMLQEYRNDLTRYMIVGDDDGYLWGWEIEGFNGIATPIKSGLAPGCPCTMAVMGGAAIIANGIDRCLSIAQDLEISNVGIMAPTTKPTKDTLVLDGDLEPEAEYKCAYTFYSRDKGTESDPSPISDVIETDASQNSFRLRIPAATLDIDDKVDAVRIYRSLAGEDILFRDTSFSDEGIIDYDGTEIFYECNCGDAELGDIMGELNDNEDGNKNVKGIPPACKYIAAHQGKIWLYETGRYSAGQITLVPGMNIVTGTNTSWRSGMNGMTLGIVGVARTYTIDKVLGDGSATLTEDYAGTAITNGQYVIYGPSNFLRYSYIDVDGAPRPESMPDDYWLNCGRGSGDIGTGLCTCGNNLLAGNSRSLLLTTGVGSASYEANPITRTTGSVSHQAMVSDGKGNCIFAARDGVYITNGGPPRSLSDGQVRGIFTGASIAPIPWQVDQAKLSYSHAVYDPTHDRYMLWLCSSECPDTVPDYCLIYDFTKVGDAALGWYWWRVRATASLVMEDADGVQRVFFANDLGFINYFHDDALNDGAGDHALRGVVTGATVNTLYDSDSRFITDDSLLGVPVHIIWSSVGAEGQVGHIVFNDSVHLEIQDQWEITPAAGDIYGIGAIDAYRSTVWMDLKSNLDKCMLRGLLFGSASDCVLTIYHDFSETPWESQTIDLTDDRKWALLRFLINRAKHYKIKIGIHGVNQNLEIFTLEFDYNTHGAYEERVRYDQDRPRSRPYYDSPEGN